jgi:perosamine synthetase
MIPVNEPLLDGNEKKYLIECIDTGWISSEGPFIRRFEELFAERVGRKHGIAVCNGSAALDAAVVALNLGPGDEVIMPAFTIISCAAAIVRAGAIPVLVDSDPNTWNMDVNQVADRIGPRTKAILVVHIYGLPVEMAPLNRLAEQFGLGIIEDAAEAHGQTYYGRACGSFGDLSTFSFYPNKHVTTGEGGMIVTDSDALAQRCRSLRNLCFKPPRRFVHDELGWNLRMTSLQAALGLAQLERLNAFLDRKRNMGRYYTAAFRDVLRGVQIPLERVPAAENLYWVYGLVLDQSVGFDADEAMKRLADRGVGSRPFFWPMHEQPVLRRLGLFANERYPVAEGIARRGFYIPSGLGLTDNQMETVVAAVKDALG